MIRTAAKQTIRADACEKFEELARELVEASRADEGNHGYTITRSTEDPHVYCFFERWESVELMMKHLQSEHFQRIGPQLDALMEGTGGLEVYEEI